MSIPPSKKQRYGTIVEELLDSDMSGGGVNVLESVVDVLKDKLSMYAKFNSDSCVRRALEKIENLKPVDQVEISSFRGGLSPNP